MNLTGFMLFAPAPHMIMITPSYYARDYYEDLVRLLIPVLQRRGVFRTEYTGRTLRDYMTQE
jgi:hypothetical protein